MNLCNVNEIRALLSRHGFYFSKSFGQNFLIDPGIPKLIAEMSEIEDSFGVLEVGPGIGALTVELAARANKVVAVELDKKLLPVLSETLRDYPNVEIINKDALKIDYRELIDEKFQGLRPVVCANIPYNITSPLISKLIECRCFEAITLMIQREVANRICAKPSTPDYGSFTIYVNYYTEPEILFDVPPSSFIPQPKVWSSVLLLKKRELPPAEISNESLFFKIVKASFEQRRKTLVNGIFAVFGDRFSKLEIQNILESCGFPSNIRGEAIDLAGFARISNKIDALLRDDY